MSSLFSRGKSPATATEEPVTEKVEAAPEPALVGAAAADSTQVISRSEPVVAEEVRPVETPRRTASIPTKPPPANRNRRPVRGPRRARLQLRHIDPWSTLKFSLVLAIAMFFVWMVAVGVLYGVLNGLGVFTNVNKLWSDLNGDDGKAIVSPSVVFGGAAVIGAVNILLFTALATIGSFIYNLCADLVGGLEVTLGERD